MLCVKTISDMTAKLQDGYKNNAMCKWILNINDAWKNRLVKYLKTENFLVSIDRASIEYQSSQADSNQKFYRIFDRSRNRFDRSKIWKTWIFEKQSILMQKLLKAQYFMNKIIVRWKVFQKHLNSTQIFQKQDF